MKLSKLILKNFRIYQNKEIHIEPGLNIIVGDNGTGKSTIIHAILFSLFGQAAVPFSVDSIPHHGKEDFEVTLSGVASKGEFSITRSKGEAKVTYGGSSVSGIVAVNNFVVSELVGVDYKLFNLVGVVNQGEIEFFSQLTKGKRKEYIGEIYNIQQIKDAVASLKEKLKNTKVELKTFESTVSTMDINKEEKELIQARKTNEEILKDLEEELFKLDEKKAEVAEKEQINRDKKTKRSIIPDDVFAILNTFSKEEIENLPAFVEEMKEEKSKQEKRDSVLEALELAKQEVSDEEFPENMKEELEELGKQYQRVYSLVTELRVLKKVHKPGGRKPRIGKKEQEFIEEFGITAGMKYAIDCPSCGNPLDSTCSVCGFDYQKANELSEKISLLEEWKKWEIYDELRIKVDAEPNASDIREKMDALTEALHRQEQQKIAQGRVEKLEAQLTEFPETDYSFDSFDTVMDCYKYMNEFISYSELPKYEINETSEDIMFKAKAVQSSVMNTMSVIQQIDSDLGYIEKLESLKKKIKELSRLKKHLTTAAKKMSEFEQLQQSRILPVIQDTASKIFQKVFPSRYSDFKVTKNFEIEIDGKGLMEFFSGGEKHLANLSLRLGITNFLKSVRGAKFKFLMLDEVSSALSDKRVGYTIDQIKQLTAIYPQILLATHHPVEIEHADNVLETD